MEKMLILFGGGFVEGPLAVPVPLDHRSSSRRFLEEIGRANKTLEWPVAHLNVSHAIEDRTRPAVLRPSDCRP